MVQEDKLTKVSRYVVHVIKAVLHNEEVETLKEEGISYQDVIAFSKFHQIENLVFSGVEKYLEEGLKNKWKKKITQNIVSSFSQIEEKNILVNEFTKNEIEFMPLKGFYLKEMYPRLDFRVMSDLDILINPKKAKKAKKIMKNLGYDVVEYGMNHHDEYLKKPFVAVELHRSLLSRDDPNYAYYEDIFERVKPSENNKYFYKMGIEDFYIFFLLHFYKHYQKGGSGIRTIIDIYILLTAKEEVIDHEYLDKELEKLKIKEFKDAMETIALEWFGNKEIENDEKIEKAKRYILSSGIHGTTKNLVDAQIESQGGDKKKTFFKRAFPEVSRMKAMYPILDKAIILLPFCYIHRILRVLIKYRGKFNDELNRYKNDKK